MIGTTLVLPASFNCNLTPEDIEGLDEHARRRTEVHHLDCGCRTLELIKTSRAT